MIELFSKQTREIVQHLVKNEHKAYYLRELAGILEIDPGNLSRAVKPLTESGLIQEVVKGRLKFFSINRNHPLYKDIKRLIGKTSGIPDMIRNILKKIEGIEKVWIYGSYVSHQMDDKSDIDLFIIGTVSSLRLATEFKSIEKRIGREIQFHVMNRDDYNKRMKKHDIFLYEMKKARQQIFP